MTTSPAINLPVQAQPPDDPIVGAYSSMGTTTMDRLRACQAALARDYARLRWLEAHPSQVDDVLEAGRSVSRRVRAIRKLVELELHEHRLRGEPELDVRGPLVTRVVALLMDSINGVTQEMVPPGDARLIIDRFTTAINDNPEIPWP